MKRIFVILSLTFGMTMSLWAQSSPMLVMTALYKSAYLHQKDHRPDDAMLCLNALLSIDSNLVQAIALKGYVYEDSYANYDSAIICYNRVAELAPRYAQNYVNIGHIHYIQGRYKEAVNSLEKAIEIDSNYADAYFNLGLIANEQHYLKDAITYMRKGIEKGSAAARRWMDEYEEKLATGKAEE